MFLIEILGIGGGLYGLVHFLRHWPEWLGYEPGPSTHIAGPDDEDVDFDAAINSLGRLER